MGILQARRLEWVAMSSSRGSSQPRNQTGVSCIAGFNILLIAAAKSLQLCPTLCDPRDSRPPGPTVPGILQARTLEWVAISFSNAWKGKVKVKSLSRVQLLATPWAAAYQAPLSTGFSRQEYQSELPLNDSKWDHVCETLNTLSNTEQNVNSVSQKQTSIEKKTIWKVKETLEREWRSGRKGGGVNKAKAVTSKESPLGVTGAPSTGETQLLWRANTTELPPCLGKRSWGISVCSQGC